ncbi:ankyrin repeat-containing domain protein, partial [Bipolaris maydis]
HHVFWIHGKAGTGQGAIASSALEYLKQDVDHNSLVASFYCDQSDRMRRTLKGLLQIIVRQLLDIDQDLARHLLLDSRGSRDVGSQIFDPEEMLKIPALWTALQKMAEDTRNSRIYIIVYGVEQLAEESLGHFLAYMGGAILEPTTATHNDGDFRPIKWLLFNRSGRPSIEKCLKGKVPEIDLNDADNSAQVSDDLKAHISVRVDELALPASLAYFVKRHIYLRAEDNWIYVSLVVRELRNAWKPGRTHYAEIRKLLESFPYGLTDMFEHIRKRILSPQAEGYEYTKEILRCRVLSYIAPTMRELAVMVGLPHDDLEDLEKLKEYIVRCGAFLTLRGNDWDLDNSTVEWIDISAAEHLAVYAKYDLSLDLDDVQHGIIALRSLEYIYQAIEVQDVSVDDAEQEETEVAVAAENTPYAADTDTDESGSDDMSDASSAQGDDETEDLLDVDLRYPVRYWVEHAKRAPPDVLEEFNFSHPFWQKDSEARQKWWNTIREVHGMEGQQDISSLHVAVILEFPALVDHLINLNGTPNVHEQDSLGFQPLYYACENGNEEIINILLGAGADVDFVSSDGNPTALHAACRNGRYDIVKILLDRNTNVNSLSPEYGTALYAAVGSLDNRIVELLLDHNAEVNITGGPHRRALNLAAFSGNLDAVRILIERGAEIDPNEEYWYGSALGAAVRRGHAPVVRYLLSKSWNPHLHIKTYRSFLSAAATYNHLEVFEILLKDEQRVLILEQALQVAAQKGYASIVAAILNRDSELSSSTLRHQRSFSLAAFYGRTEVLRLLYPRGIDQAQLDEALYEATDNKHLETVKLLLEFGADPNVGGPIYGFALAASAYDGTMEIMKALLDKGADVNKRGGDYGTALQAAAWFGDADNVKLLLDRGAKTNTEPIGYYGHELQAAVHTGNEATIRLLIEHGADVNAFGGHFSYAIIAAVDQGDSTATKILLEHGAHVNVRGGEDNWPVISLAASTLLTEDLELIIKNVSDIDAACARGTTALINCADACDIEGLRFLLVHGADVHISSEKYGTALHAAAAEGDEDCCEVLLEAGANVNAIGGPYGTALQAAAWAGDIETIHVLVKAGADITITEPISGTYGTALQAACAAGWLDVVQELLKHNAAVNVRPANGMFGGALSAAAAGGHRKIVNLLIKHHADVNASGGLHGFPILAAAQSGVLSVVECLLNNGANATASGGLLGSTVAAAVKGNNIKIVRKLIGHGADVHAKGGKYGDALQTAAMKAEISMIDEILDRAIELVNHKDGKYHTALIAASYFNRMDVVNKLLDAGADFRVQGGVYRSAIAAASIRGNRAILDRYLSMKPPDHLLDEALVEACAYRQAACVDALLKAGANVYARHPTRGSASDAIDTLEEDYNSDLEEDNLDSDAVSKHGEDEDEDEEEEKWEGDNVSVSGQTDEGSVTDLQLEEDVSEEAKIRKLLKEAQDRCKRNPTVKRFRTVKYGHMPPSLSVGSHPHSSVPRLPSNARHGTYEAADSADRYGVPYGQHLQSSSSLPYPIRSRTIETITEVEHETPYPSIGARGGTFPLENSTYQDFDVQPPDPLRTKTPETIVPRRESAPLPNSQRPNPLAGTAIAPQPNAQPSKKGSIDHGLKRQSKVVNRKSIANLEALTRYQQQQRQSSYSMDRPPLHSSISEQDHAAESQPSHPPPHHMSGSYDSQINPIGIRNEPYRPPIAHQQSQHFVQSQPYGYPGLSQPTQGPYCPYPQDSTAQQPYLSYPQHAEISSPASTQGSQYTGNSSQYQPWDTPPSSVSGFTSTQNTNEKRGNRWASGGYDGEGYDGQGYG